MPKAHRYGSDSKSLDAGAAANDNDGENRSHQGLGGRHPDLRDAPPIVMAENETELNKRTMDLAREMAEAGVPWEEIFEMYGDAFDLNALSRTVDKAEMRQAELEDEDEDEASSPPQHSPPESPKWQDYDPKEWENAADKANIDKAFDDYRASVSALAARTEKLADAPSSSKSRIPVSLFGDGPSASKSRLPVPVSRDPPSASKSRLLVPHRDAPWVSRPKPPVPPFGDVPSTSNAKPVIPVVEATFIRALKDSDAESKPSFAKGDILRIIGHKRRGDSYFEVLPLKPPGDAGRALRSSFEAADQEAVDEVGREARTEKEKDNFKAAVEWKD